MYRQTFIPTLHSLTISINIPAEWQGKEIEVIAFPKENKGISEITYSYLQQEKQRQMQLIAAGKMQKPVLTDDVFTIEQEVDFNRKTTIDDIFNK